MVGFVFAAVLLVGLIATYEPVLSARTTPTEIVESILWGVLVAALLSLAFDRVGRRLWHDLANAFPEKTLRPILTSRVIDGDTIEDVVAGVTFRFANIDAPETGDGARCPNEARRGELARLAVVAMVKRAKKIEVRQTWRWDQYGRRVAFVYVDSADIGEALIAKGFARPWRGKREKWCGPRGGLAQIGKTRAMPISCKSCGAWSKF
jgi:micrococcal nuclease